MSKNRLYTVNFISAPDEAYRIVPASEASEEEFWQSQHSVFIMGIEQYKIPIGWEPEGWKEYALEVWGPDVEYRDYDRVTVLPYKPFFWPKTDKIWKSRSSAQKVVNIIRAWGGTAEVLECTPQWETIPAANARRKRERNAPRIARLKAELEALELS